MLPEFKCLDVSSDNRTIVDQWITDTYTSDYRGLLSLAEYGTLLISIDVPEFIINTMRYENESIHEARERKYSKIELMKACLDPIREFTINHKVKANRIDVKYLSDAFWQTEFRIMAEGEYPSLTQIARHALGISPFPLKVDYINFEVPRNEIGNSDPGEITAVSSNTSHNNPIPELTGKEIVHLIPGQSKDIMSEELLVVEISKSLAISDGYDPMEEWEEFDRNAAATDMMTGDVSDDEIFPKFIRWEQYIPKAQRVYEVITPYLNKV